MNKFNLPLRILLTTVLIIGIYLLIIFTNSLSNMISLGISLPFLVLALIKIFSGYSLSSKLFKEDLLSSLGTALLISILLSVFFGQFEPFEPVSENQFDYVMFWSGLISLTPPLFIFLLSAETLPLVLKYCYKRLRSKLG